MPKTKKPNRGNPNLLNKLSRPEVDETPWKPGGLHLAALSVWSYVRTNKHKLDSGTCVASLQKLIMKVAQDLNVELIDAHTIAVREVNDRIAENEVAKKQLRDTRAELRDLRKKKDDAIEYRNKLIDDLRSINKELKTEFATFKRHAREKERAAGGSE